MARRTTSKGPTTVPTTARVAVLKGKDAFLRAQHTQDLRARLAEAHGDVDLIHFDGQTAQPADVLDECRSFGLMQQHKLVVVDQADDMVKGDSRPLFERYCESPSEGATLVLRCETWRPSNLDKAIEDPERGAGGVVACEPPTPAQAVNWAGARCKKQHGGTIGRQAAALLVERLGADLGRIDAELGKLAAAAGGEEITPELVAEFVGVSREEEVWGIQANLLAGSPESVLAHLRDLIEVSRQPTELIGFAFCDLARKLHAMTAAIAGGANPAGVAKELRLWGPSAQAVQTAARRFTPAQTLALLDAAIEADLYAKTGRGVPARLLERVALRFSGAA
ncbi:MAG: DNA polymerase III subunit delta [Planctomycetota bacterium]